MFISFTGEESTIPSLPFLLDQNMNPVSAVNRFLREEIAFNGASASKLTRRIYGYHMFDYCNFLENEKISWEEVTNEVLFKYRETQDKNISQLTGRHISRTTINARLLVIGRFYQFAIREKLLTSCSISFKTLHYRTPRDVQRFPYSNRNHEKTVLTVTYERLPKNDIKWETKENIQTWLNSIDQWRNKLIGKVAINTGMRRAELVSLTVDMLPDPETINANFFEVTFSIIGKRKRRRDVVISTRLYYEILDYIKLERNPVMKKHGRNHRYIFVTSTGENLAAATLNTIFTKISQKCGICIRPHMLRHSFAMNYCQHLKKIGHSQPQKALQKRLGHSNISTTEIYMHLSDEDVANESLAFSAFIDDLFNN